jgi:AAA ATPase domain
VGRRQELAEFEQSLALPAGDPRRRFLFAIHGDAGVGKTFLVRQLCRLADERGAVHAYVDEVYDAPEAMAAIAADFRRRGHPLKEFEKRHQLYRQRRRELEVDPDAPEGVSSFLTKTAVRVGLRAAHGVPVVGALAGVVDEQAAAEQLDRFCAYVGRKIHGHDEFGLVLSPTEELTPLFVGDLRDAAESRPLVVFFDTYERSSVFLDPWLRGLDD